MIIVCNITQGNLNVKSQRRITKHECYPVFCLFVVGLLEVFCSEDASPGMEVPLVDVHHDQFEQAEDGEQEGDEPGQLGDQLKGVRLFLENPNQWLDGQVSLADIRC